jgi:hypothetical protein
MVNSLEGLFDETFEPNPNHRPSRSPVDLQLRRAEIEKTPTEAGVFTEFLEITR